MQQPIELKLRGDAPTNRVKIAAGFLFYKSRNIWLGNRCANFYNASCLPFKQMMETGI